MYQEKSGNIQNRLVNLWVQVSTKHEGFIGSKQAALVKSSADIVEMGLKWLLGDKLISIQFVVVSLCMSIASLCVVFGFSDLYRHKANQEGGTILIALIFGGLYSLYGLFAARFVAASIAVYFRRSLYIRRYSKNLT
jgi:hypothetical protein